LTRSELAPRRPLPGGRRFLCPDRTGFFLQARVKPAARRVVTGEDAGRDGRLRENRNSTAVVYRPTTKPAAAKGAYHDSQVHQRGVGRVALDDSWRLGTADQRPGGRINEPPLNDDGSIEETPAASWSAFLFCARPLSFNRRRSHGSIQGIRPRSTASSSARLRTFFLIRCTRMAAAWYDRPA
jgi:hypothetical protein